MLKKQLESGNKKVPQRSKKYKSDNKEVLKEQVSSIKTPFGATEIKSIKGIVPRDCGLVQWILSYRS
jgi:hypothetical protein